VEETLNGLLQAEADRLCQAKRYQRGWRQLHFRTDDNYTSARERGV
jgi:hypothetical protein